MQNAAIEDDCQVTTSVVTMSIKIDLRSLGKLAISRIISASLIAGLTSSSLSINCNPWWNAHTIITHIILGMHVIRLACVHKWDIVSILP